MKSPVSEVFELESESFNLNDLISWYLVCLDFIIYNRCLIEWDDTYEKNFKLLIIRISEKENVLEELKLQTIFQCISQCRLRWPEHFQRKDLEDCQSKFWNMT